MEVSDLTAGVSVFAGHTVGFQPEYSTDYMASVSVESPGPSGSGASRNVTELHLVCLSLFNQLNGSKDLFVVSFNRSLRLILILLLNLLFQGCLNYKIVKTACALGTG